MDCPNPVLGVAQGETLAPLRLIRECCVPLDLVEENLRQTFQRQYEPFNDLMRMTLAIVGSGPSILETVSMLDPGDHVLACNASHDYLIGRGIVPKYAMLFDAAEVIASMFTPHKDVTYLIASRCHPKVFEKLEGFKVVVWHAGADEEGILAKLEEAGKNEPVIHGGSAAVVRAMFLGAAMGYKRLRIFGGDSSFAGEHTHFKKSAVPEKEISVFCNHRWFRTTAWMAAQAEEVQIIFPIIKGIGIDIEVVGDGLIPHIAQTMGYNVTGAKA